MNFGGRLPLPQKRCSKQRLFIIAFISLILSWIAPLAAQLEINCLDHYNAGQRVDGLYNISLIQVVSPVLCDMTRGGWTMVFYHDYSNTSTRTLSPIGTLDSNVNNPSALIYSIMTYLPFMKAIGSPYQFMFEWPDSKFSGPQMWNQFDIGTGNDIVPDFYPIEVSYQTNFIGLQFTPPLRLGRTSYTGMPVTAGWGFAVMQHSRYYGGLWGPINVAPVLKARLWMRPVACHPSCASCRGSGVTDCLSCAAGLSLSPRGYCGNPSQLSSKFLRFLLINLLHPPPPRIELIL